MTIKRKQKILILMKLIVFNTFFVGFVATLISYLNSNWIENDSICYGLFEHCRKLDGSVSYLILNSNERRLIHNLFMDLQCVSWNHNRPKYLNPSVYCLSFGLSLHFMAMFTIVIYTLVANNNTFSTKSPTMINLCKFIRRHSIREWLGSILGFLLLIAYGSNLTSIVLGQVFNRSENKQERFGWCFWLACAGFIITLLPVLIVSIHTYLKKLEIFQTTINAESSFESDSLSYESFNGMFNIRSTDLNKIFYNQAAITNANSISTIINLKSKENQIENRYTKKKKGNKLFGKLFCLKNRKSGEMSTIRKRVTSKPKSYKTVTSYEFFKKTLPALRQSDIYEPVKSIENLYSQIYSVVKLPVHS